MKFLHWLNDNFPVMFYGIIQRQPRQNSGHYKPAQIGNPHNMWVKVEMIYEIMFPPNTKDATATKKGNLLVVNCPHCKGSHYHTLADKYKSYIEANCRLGFYVIRSVVEGDKA